MLREPIIPDWDADPADGRNLALFLDGTWNYEEQLDEANGVAATSPTNVYKLCQEIDVSAGDQLPLYLRGVGNDPEHSFLGEVVGGVFGWGAFAQRDEAYYSLLQNYRRGDRIYLFGFSRGAAVARMLANLITVKGVPDRLEFKQRPVGKPGGKRKKITVPVFHGKHDVAVEMMGLWDTVAAFGVPVDVMGIPFSKINLFRDLKLAGAVKQAYHLLAVDEVRDAFQPTLFEPSPRVREVWFPGIHSNVGGGYSTSGLSDIALEYMIKCAESHGLRINEDFKQDLSCNACGVLRVAQSLLFDNIPRTIPEGALIHRSVFERRERDNAYRPENLPHDYQVVV